MCTLFRRKKKETTELIKTHDVYQDEHDLMTAINDYRFWEDKLDALAFNGYLQTLAKTRTEFWDENNYTEKDNLHDFLFGHRKPYLDSGMFTKIVELANYGLINDFGDFKNSPEHNSGMLGDYKYIGVSMLDKYCCVILGK